MTKERDEYFGVPRQVRFPYKDDDVIQRRIDTGETPSDVIRQLVASGISHGTAYHHCIPAIPLELTEKLLLDRFMALFGSDPSNVIKSLVLNEAHRTLNAHDERLRAATPPADKTQP
ncbi:hypothetical protein [Sphingomonas sp. GC_Shp_3]|jgi:hypothetical protein|uniref:hypothetical protein n=1 Tax=Sphingomonas sp. GC_Shp_3 TaxID=2937383 RepID=UPI002269BBE3|nr:hypothetical protein [Sphingomonas sp. GC_Shp_3]